MANVGSGAAGKTFIGAGNGASGTFASIGTNSGLTAHSVVIAEGTGAFSVASPSTAGQALISNGAGADPTFQTVFPATVLLKRKESRVLRFRLKETKSFASWMTPNNDLLTAG